MPYYDDQGLPDEAFTETERAAGVPALARGHSDGYLDERTQPAPSDYPINRNRGANQAPETGELWFRTFQEARTWAMQNPGRSFGPAPSGTGYKPRTGARGRKGETLTSRKSVDFDSHPMTPMLERYCPYMLRFWTGYDPISQFNDAAMSQAMAQLSLHEVREFQAFLLDFKRHELWEIECFENMGRRDRRINAGAIHHFQSVIRILDRALGCVNRFVEF